MIHKIFYDLPPNYLFRLTCDHSPSLQLPPLAPHITFQVHFNSLAISCFFCAPMPLFTLVHLHGMHSQPCLSGRLLFLHYEWAQVSPPLCGLLVSPMWIKAFFPLNLQVSVHIEPACWVRIVHLPTAPEYCDEMSTFFILWGYNCYRIDRSPASRNRLFHLYLLSPSWGTIICWTDEWIKETLKTLSSKGGVTGTRFIFLFESTTVKRQNT